MSQWIRKRAPSLGWGLMFVLPIIFLFVNTFVELAKREMVRMDRRLLIQAATLRTPWLTEWMKGITELGQGFWQPAWFCCSKNASCREFCSYEGC